MKNKNLIRFVESLVLLPILTVSTPSLPASGLADGTNTYSQIVLSEQYNKGVQDFFAFNQASDPVLDPKVEMLDAQAKAIDAYFKERKMPLEGMGMKMAIEADKNVLDWRLLPAIAIRESTGGKNACKKVTFNPFGWGSCKIGFKSNDLAIETVARNLGGNNPNTAHHYDEKTTLQILRAYNPPSIVPKYAEQVISIMKNIGPEEIIITPATKT